MTLRTLDLREAKDHRSLTTLRRPVCKAAQLELWVPRGGRAMTNRPKTLQPFQPGPEYGSTEAILDMSAPADVTWRKTETHN